MVEKKQIIKLRFKSSLHIGLPYIGLEKTQEYISSDTLFSAICNAWAELFPEDLEEDLKLSDASKLPFKISSAFPYVDNNYFFPKPFIRIPDKSLKEEKRKELEELIKDIEFIEKEHFEAWINGKELKDYIEKIKTTQEILKNAIKKQLLPHTTLDRQSMTSELYFVEILQFAKDIDCGLYFMVEFKNNNEIKDKFNKVLNYLGEVGIGGERTVGCGFFKFEEDSLEIQLPNDNAHCILSLYYPTEDEIKKIIKPDNDCAYKLTERSGWVVSPQIKKEYRRKKVFMFKEGSVFNFLPEGSFADVTPAGFTASHKVLRYGYALAIPIKKDV